MSERCEVIIVAGGLGRRMQTESPKAFLTIGQKSILAYAIDCFASVKQVAGLILVVPEGYEQQSKRLVATCLGRDKVKAIVIGGARRQDSVQAGLDQLHGETALVLIHDAARIFTTPQLVENVINETKKHPAVIPGLAVADTLKRINDNQEVTTTIERRQLVAIQTPQGFQRALLIKAYKQAWADNITATDDAGLVEHVGHPIRVIEGDQLNFKITTPCDLKLAEIILSQPQLEVRA